MTEKDGIVTFESDKDNKNKEILNSTQRNNQLVFPDPTKYPKAQYATNWKNMCNVTSYIMFLEYSGAKFPTGNYSQPEDNLGYFILTDERILEKYKKSQPVLYNAWQKSMLGTATKTELKNAYPPNELHDYLAMGANLWLGYEAAKFSTNVNFKKLLWREMVDGNNAIVVSTVFGGLGHVVCVTGVKYKKDDYVKIRDAKLKKLDVDTLINTIDPVGIIIDDPWGKYDPTTNKYIATSGGNDIFIPWDVVVSKVKPAGSPSTKWAHYIVNQGMATV